MNEPFFSVVIPAYGRAAGLVACLHALRALEQPSGGFEVIVVDDGGAQPLELAIAPLAADLSITLLRQPHKGPAAARNLGARAARGSHLAFLDADCIAVPSWLTILQVALLGSGPDALVGGRTVDGAPENRYSVASHHILDVVASFYNPPGGSPGFFPATNLAVVKRRFLEAGGFREDFVTSEDRELCYRWQRLDYPLVHAPEAVVQHRHPVGLRRFLVRHFGYGRGSHRFSRLRAHSEACKLRLAPLDFYVALLRPRLIRGRELADLDRAALVILSQAASSAGFVWEALRSGFERGRSA